MGKREIESNITGRVSSGNTIKAWTQDVTKSDRKRVGVMVVVQRVQEERESGHFPDICVNSQLAFREKNVFFHF